MLKLRMDFMAKRAQNEDWYQSEIKTLYKTFR
jgi:hypothetical protein